MKSTSSCARLTPVRRSLAAERAAYVPALQGEIVTALVVESDTDADRVTLDELAFDKPEICDIEGCDRTAKWRCILRCCGQTMLMCEDCMDWHLEAIANGVLFTHIGKSGCGAHDIKQPFLSAERI